MLGAALGLCLASPNLGKGDALGECPFAKVRRQSQGSATSAFDPVKQKIDVSGTHAFQPPNPGDLRGPCPGLNALANHGYLPRSGLVTFNQAIQACNSVFGMGVDIATTLATLGVVLTGNPETDQFSIGGSPGGDIVPPLISLPQGLSGSHNKYETDASPGRGDYYLHNGDASSLDLRNFKSLYALQPGNNRERAFQLQPERANSAPKANIRFLNQKLTGTILSNGAHAFIPALMSNHSDQFPNGILSRDVLKSFFGAQGTSKNLTYLLGHERIPNNWYRRPADKDYESTNLGSDIAQMLAVAPNAISVGGNVGKVNTFTMVNISDLTGGLYNHLICNDRNALRTYALQVGLPDVLETLFSNVTYAEALVAEKYGPVLSSMGCPGPAGYNKTSFKAFPGTNDGGWF
ncbi:hypothetical protein FRC09_015129 [Ceratobasidium sp. 395]|nr:hypothetical protein FRC09_015129 [Ceratobasidium sp. 395]